MMAMKLVMKIAVSLMESLPPALTKCKAHPTGTNTNSTFLHISNPFHMEFQTKSEERTKTYNQEDRAAALKLLNNVGAFPTFLSGVNNPVVILLNV